MPPQLWAADEPGDRRLGTPVPPAVAQLTDREREVLLQTHGITW